MEYLNNFGIQFWNTFKPYFVIPLRYTEMENIYKAIKKTA